MMFSKLIFISTLGLYAGSVLFAENVKGPIVRHEQLNPGLDRQVNIVPMRKYKSEVTYTVTTLPRHGTLYYDGVKIEDPGFTLNDPNKVTIDPEDSNVTAVFSYTSTDSAGNVSAPRNIIMRFLDIQISGSVFHDYDGNGIVDGDRISNLNGEPLYVTLVNKENRILSSKLVSKKGRYRFDNSDGLQPNTNYAIIISTQKNVFSSILPEKWSYSGENINSLGRGKDGHKDGIIVVKVREKDIADIDFGLDIRPVAENKKQPTQLNPGGETQVVVPALEGSDAENGEKVRFYISELPKNATLYNNGKKVSKAGIEIKDPDRLTLDPDDGDQSVAFRYVTADKIGVVSYPAIVEMSFSGLTISGQVLNDGNKNEIVDGQPISALDDSKLYVTLLNDRNIVLNSVKTNVEGRYRFDGTQGVVPESDYRVVLSTEPNAKRSHLPKVWNASSEGIMGKNLKSDSLKDGSVAVHVGKKDVSDVDFGVNKKPEAETLRVEPQLNPGGEARVGVPVLKGTDHENIQGLTYSITALPEHAKLYYGDRHIDKKNFIVDDPAKLTLDPDDGQLDIRFSYKVTDESGIDSEPATVQMSFNELILSGHLFDDGNNDNNVSGELLGEVESRALYVLLLDKKKTLLAAKPFKRAMFTFNGKDGVKPESTFFIALATAPESTAFGLPKTWNNTGEAINSLEGGRDSRADGVILVNVAEGNITDIDFGINKQPVAENKETRTQLNPGLEITVAVPTLSGSDRESGENLKYTIETLPTLGTLYYHNMKIEQAGFEVEEPDGLTLDPKNSDQIVLFAYTVTDEAGVTSDPARVQMAFKGLHISGRIVNDGDGDDRIKGKAIRIPKGMKPYATLLDQNNTILASNPLTRDATFSFDGTDGVRPNADFTVVISLEKNSREPVLPSKWVESGAGTAAAEGQKENESDGKLTVHVFEENIDDITFGINKKPTADPKTGTKKINPGGNTRVPVPTLSGQDRESGTRLRYMIKALPENATLYNKGKEVSLNDYVDSKSLTIDPKDGKQEVEFAYVTVDPENIQSEPAKVTMSFTGLSISGHIFEDFDLDGMVDSATTVAADQIRLFVTLLSEKGEVLASVPVQKDGSYMLDASTGVNANTKYRLVLAKDANMTKSVLPQGWHYADGENVNSLGKGTDGKADGMIDVWVKETDLKQVDFGINYLLQ